MLRNRGRSRGRTGLKVLYALSLVGLCTYVVAGPVVATTITGSTGNLIYLTNNGSYNSYTANAGGVTTDVATLTAVIGNSSFYCNGTCGNAVYSYNVVYNELPAGNYLVSVTLSGGNTSLYSLAAWGNTPAITAYADGYLRPVVTTSSNSEYAMIYWTASTAGLVAGGASATTTSFVVEVLDGLISISGISFIDEISGIGRVSPTLTIAVTEYTATPEPTSACLLFVGFAVVEYLRRKSRT